MRASAVCGRRRRCEGERRGPPVRLGPICPISRNGSAGSGEARETGVDQFLPTVCKLDFGELLGGENLYTSFGLISFGSQNLVQKPKRSQPRSELKRSHTFGRAGGLFKRRNGLLHSHQVCVQTTRAVYAAPPRISTATRDPSFLAPTAPTNQTSGPQGSRARKIRTPRDY